MTRYFTIAIMILIAVQCGCRGHYPLTEDKKMAEKNRLSLENGKNLAFNICGQCHYDAHTGKFSGKRMHDLPHFMGRIFSADLTTVPNGVMSRYSDAELAWLLKTGTGRDGRYVPYMMRPNLSDEDLNDIIIYLRSSGPALMPADTSVPLTHLNVLGKMATRFSGKPLPYKTKVLRPDSEDLVSVGRYLVDNMGCYHCHSGGIQSLNYLQPERSKHYLQGGMKFRGPDGKPVYAANLTPDKETGTGYLTAEQFRNLIREGRLPWGDYLRLPMQRFPHLTNKQADAIFLYLQSLKPVRHKVKHY